MRLRMKTRSLMIVIVLVAIALVTPGEVRNRRYRRHLARLREWHLRYAENHEKERAVCEASTPMDPYDPEARKSYLSGYCFQTAWVQQLENRGRVAYPGIPGKSEGGRRQRPRRENSEASFDPPRDF